MSEDKKEQDGPQPPFAESASNMIESILSDDRVVQAFVMIMTEDDEIVRTKGHFYDNATLLNSILGDFKEKIYLDIFSGPKPKM